jgi:ATP-dependent DNA helicase RecG
VGVTIDDRITVLPDVGRKVDVALRESLGLATIRQLLEHYPRRYQDAGEVLDLSQVQEGEPATLLGEVVKQEHARIPKGKGRPRPLDRVTLTVRQASGASFTATFFNQRWRTSQLPTGTVAAFSGKVKRFRSTLQLTNPDVQPLGRVGEGLDSRTAADRLEHQRLLAVYPTAGAVTTLTLNRLVTTALETLPTIPDWLDEAVLDEHDLVDLDTAIRGIHDPEDHETAVAARRRLAFDELLVLQLGLQWRRARLEADTVGLDNGPQPTGRAQDFLAALPFAPTGAQTRAFASIGEDLARTRPMHRLLQGDVGSGKTLVAVWSMLCAVDNGRQAALMVPTEVLAEQHHRTLTELLAPLGVNVLDGIRVELLTSSTTQTQRRRILGELLEGRVDIVVGTHALLEEGVRFADLGVVVIDEQHRFGVAQRVRLRDKTAATGTGVVATPDVLVMTATPIPRSLALTLYGDLDVTVLDELPPGREPITTRLLTPDEAHRRDALYDFVRAEVAEGRRAYVVCPFVEPSDAIPGTSAIEEHHRLATQVFPDLEVALVHGRLRSDEKDAAMTAFRTGAAQVLVATTVIEVGVDVPEATVMIVEDAERFGISQLHQLRGRVGRGSGRSFCVLFAGWQDTEVTKEARTRLQAIVDSSDGFELAEVDLELRGEGTLFGRDQSGGADLKLARVTEDLDLIGLTRDLARAVIEADPALEAPEHARLRAEVLRRHTGGIDDFEALQTG